MAKHIENLKACIILAERFCKRANAAIDEKNKYSTVDFSSSLRASMDLTRGLSDLRAHGISRDEERDARRWL
jgi:hypothetical protein